MKFYFIFYFFKIITLNNTQILYLYYNNMMSEFAKIKARKTIFME